MIAPLPKEALDDLRNSRAEFLTLIRTLTEIPAPTGHEEARAAFCKQWLEEAGAKNIITDAAGNVIYPYNCEGDDSLVVFMAHLDTVFSDPCITVRQEGSRWYAPGIGDDTANLAVLLMAARYLVQHRPKGSHGLLLVANTGEEGEGNLRGCRQIFQDYAGRIAEFVSYDSQFSHYTTLPIGSMRYRIIARTAGGHSYHAFGTPNAIAVLSDVIHQLYAITPPDGTTFNVGRISGGTSVNSIAQEAQMLWEFRSGCAEHLQQMDARLRAVLANAQVDGVTLETEIIGVRPCRGEVDPARQEALYQRVRDAVSLHSPTPAVEEFGSTDANIPWSLGIPSTTVGTILTGGPHTYGEWIDVEQAPEGLAFGLHLILSYCD